MLYHDKELTLAGVRPPASWFGDRVLWSVPRRWCVSEHSSTGGYTIIATGQACEHCGFMDKDHVTDLHISSMQDEDHYHGLTHPDVRHNTFSFAHVWMAEDDLVEPIQRKLRDEIREEENRAAAAALAKKATLMMVTPAFYSVFRLIMENWWWP